jgi:hypothetical protein
VKNALRLFAVAVTAAGMGLLAYVVLTQHDRIDLTSPVFWVLAICVLAGELVPIKIPRQNEVIWVTVSGMFAFSLIITFGIAGALVALIPASVIDDFLSKKPPWRWGFNAGAYTIATCTAGGLVYLFSELPVRSDPTHFVGADLIAILLGATVFFAVNWCLAGIAVALMKNVPVFATLRSNLGLDMAIDSILLSLSPLVVAAAGRSLFLIPLLALPMLAAYQTARVAQRSLGLAKDLRESPQSESVSRSGWQRNLRGRTKRPRPFGCADGPRSIQGDKRCPGPPQWRFALEGGEPTACQRGERGRHSG